MEDDDGIPTTRWFGDGNSVRNAGGGRFDVFLRGALIGSFLSGDTIGRDALLAIITTDPRVKIPAVATAFGVQRSVVYRARSIRRAGGLEAILTRRRPGAPTKVHSALVARVCKMFDEGVGVRAAYRAVEAEISYGSVQQIHETWANERKPRAATAATAATARIPATQEELQLEPPPPELFEGDEESGADTAVAASPHAAVVGVVEAPATSSNEDGGTGLTPGATLAELAPDDILQGKGPVVQNVGAWIMLAMLQSFGLYRIAERLRGEGTTSVSLRVAIDAVAISLTLGLRTVEGIRRIATATMKTLLRHRSASSPSWVRRVLHAFADNRGATPLHLAIGKVMAERSSKAHAHDDDRMLVYVDNHMRPYTGKHLVRKGWRMQDKRALPGTSDYSVNDELGRPLFRVAVPSHGSLTDWLRPIGAFIRDALDGEVRPLLVFDRGGAFPDEMAALRDEGFDFVTYERAQSKTRDPYPMLAKKSFTRSVEFSRVSTPDKPFKIRFTEAPAKNLRKGRGRVRRIAILTPDGKQINILAWSELPAEELIRALLLRWGRQENPFKHGVERWGINQLDGRRVEPYPPGESIPNPARRKLDRSLRLARAAEGEARRKLALENLKESKRKEAELALVTAMKVQRDLEELRPSVPTHAPVEETELAGRLVQHTTGYKDVIDTIRIALANAESDLALELAPHLKRPREAKRILGNLFSASGTVAVNKRSISVVLDPAGTQAEKAALATLLVGVNNRKLPLPGASNGRVLRFRLRS